jgi:hypothetical protein
LLATPDRNDFAPPGLLAASALDPSVDLLEEKMPLLAFWLLLLTSSANAPEVVVIRRPINMLAAARAHV